MELTEKNMKKMRFRNPKNRYERGWNNALNYFIDE